MSGHLICGDCICTFYRIPFSKAYADQLIGSTPAPEAGAGNVGRESGSQDLSLKERQGCCKAGRGGEVTPSCSPVLPPLVGNCSGSSQGHQPSASLRGVCGRQPWGTLLPQPVPPLLPSCSRGLGLLGSHTIGAEFLGPRMAPPAAKTQSGVMGNPPAPGPVSEQGTWRGLSQLPRQTHREALGPGPTQAPSWSPAPPSCWDSFVKLLLLCLWSPGQRGWDVRKGQRTALWEAGDCGAPGNQTGSPLWAR